MTTKFNWWVEILDINEDFILLFYACVFLKYPASTTSLYGHQLIVNSPSPFQTPSNLITVLNSEIKSSKVFHFLILSHSPARDLKPFFSPLAWDLSTRALYYGAEPTYVHIPTGKFIYHQTGWQLFTAWHPL